MSQDGEQKPRKRRDRGCSAVTRELDTEAAIAKLGIALYRYSRRYDYDNAHPDDAMREAREIVTKALKGEEP